MTSNKNNKIFEKTSFLQGSNSPFIKELYLKYLKNPNSIPESWVEFFSGLDEDQEAIKKEILGPSWGPKKVNVLNKNSLEKNINKNKKNIINKNLLKKKNYEKEKEESVKAIVLIRAYRIRGHLIANLDPLSIQKKR